MATSGAFKPGDPRIYKGGVKHKRSEIAEERMKAVGFDPLLELIKLSQTTRSDKVRVECLTWLGDKMYPSLKAVEHTGDKDAPVIMRFNLAQINSEGEKK